MYEHNVFMWFIFIFGAIFFLLLESHTTLNYHTKIQGKL